MMSRHKVAVFWIQQLFTAMTKTINPSYKVEKRRAFLIKFSNKICYSVVLEKNFDEFKQNLVIFKVRQLAFLILKVSLCLFERMFFPLVFQRCRVQSFTCSMSRVHPFC